MSDHLPHRARRSPELLAPAGGPDALRAAVNNGADAVYLGLGELNARRGAENFDLEGMAEACAYAHLRGARVYLTANVLVAAEEVAGALEMIDAAWVAGIDAVILQDLGLMRLVRAHLPHVRIHASTQIDAHNTESVRTLAGLGASRVTLARETSLPEIAAFARGGAAEIESFVHGSLCFCYSGQCLLSSLIGGRSANRGLCAQPCRMAYALVGPNGTEVDVPGAYLLSPKDLAGLDLLPALVGSGVAALKIEGRMKAPEYVALVTGVYSAALDRAIADPDGFASTEAEWSVLVEAFSRGFTPAYLAGVRDDTMMSHTRPNNRGVLVGRVTQAAEGAATVALELPLEPDDTVEFWTGTGRFAQRAGALEVDGRAVTTAPAGAGVRIATERRVSRGDRVFRVASASLTAAARRTFAEPSDVPVDFSVRLRVGEPAVVTARADGAEGVATGPTVEPARTKALQAAEVIEHVGRTGGSGFAQASWEMDLDPAAGAGYSTLHALRREALESLAAAMLAPWAGRERTHPAPGPARGPGRAAPSAPELVVSGHDTAVLRACLAAGADRALLNAAWSATEEDPPAGVEPLVPRVVHDEEAERVLTSARRAGRATVGNLGMLAAAVRAGVAAEADWPLNAFNAWSCAALADLGATLVWASPELAAAQLEAMCASSPLPVGALVFGRTELMVAEHCVLRGAGPCSETCGTCARRRGWWRLRDRKGYEFPITSDAAGRAHIVNSVPLDLSRALDRVVASGVSAVRLEMTVEDEAEAVRITRGMRRALDAVVAGAEPPSEALVSPSTSGHLFRGVR